MTQHSWEDLDNLTMPDNVHPIRQDATFVFDANTPIEDTVVQERIRCRRYEAGLCRDCDDKRGEFTPWCRVHFPWGSQEWVEKGRGWTREDLEGME